MLRDPLGTRFVAALLATACGTTTADDMLEDVDFSVIAGEYPHLEQWSLSGATTVRGDGRDYMLQIEDAATTLGIHTPGMSDLALLDGRVLDVTIVQEEEARNVERIEVTDEHGPLYLAVGAQTGDGGADPWFGENFARFGARLGREEHDGWRFVYRSVVLETDDGDVEVFPGEAKYIRIDGDHWRVVLVAAYTTHDIWWQGDGHSKCPPSYGDTLSFEALRMEEPAEDAAIERPLDMDPAISARGC